MSASPEPDLDLLIPSADPAQANLWEQSQDRIRIRLTRATGPEPPDYDWDGELEISAFPFRISHELTYRRGEMAEFYDALRALVDGSRAEARFTTLIDVFEVVLSQGTDDRFEVHVELRFSDANTCPVTLRGYALSRQAALSLLRRLRLCLNEVPA
jgi:hypothetical protein